MNDSKIVRNMVEFIEAKERQMQNNKLGADSQIKNDIVKSILDELERECGYED